MSGLLSSHNTEVCQGPFCKLQYCFIDRRIAPLRRWRTRWNDAERAVDILILRSVSTQFCPLHGVIPRGNVAVARIGQPHLPYNWAIIICAPNLVILPDAILVSRIDPACVFRVNYYRVVQPRRLRTVIRFRQHLNQNVRAPRVFSAPATVDCIVQRPCKSRWVNPGFIPYANGPPVRTTEEYARTSFQIDSETMASRPGEQSFLAHRREPTNPKGGQRLQEDPLLIHSAGRLRAILDSLVKDRKGCAQVTQHLVSKTTIRYNVRKDRAMRRAQFAMKAPQEAQA